MTPTSISPARVPMIIGTLALGAAGLLGITACGSPAGSPAATIELAAEAQTLSVLGVESGLETLGAAAPSQEAAKKDGKRGPARQLLRKNSLHGELTVNTKDGVRTVAAQRGTVTAVTDTGVTVKSTDGFTATWAFGDKLRVRQAKQDAERGAVKNGVEVAVAGAKNGDAFTARLIVVK
jgi:hypothetical protein